MFKGNAIVGQSGGPTAVINASLAGVIEAAVRSKTIDRIFGMRFGIEGVLNDFLLDLGNESPAHRQRAAHDAQQRAWAPAA